MYHYVYRITNIKLVKHYYGKRSSKIPPKDDIGVKYFSSSTDSEFIDDQQNHPQNYRYKVVKVVPTSIEAIKYEILLHAKFDVGVNLKFYNKCKQTSVGFDTTGLKLTEEQKAKISPLGRKLSEETKLKISKSNKGKQCWCKGKKRGPLSDYTKKLLSEAMTGKTHTAKSKEKMSKDRSGSGNVRAKVVNVYSYPDNKLVAASVVCTVWCKGTEYTSNMLLQTLKRDLTKPHCFSTRPKRKDDYNPIHYKGLYVVLV